MDSVHCGLSGAAQLSAMSEHVLYMYMYIISLHWVCDSYAHCFLCPPVGLPLSEEGMEDVSRVCRHIQSWSIRSAQTECNKSSCALLWKVRFVCIHMFYNMHLC